MSKEVKRYNFDVDKFGSPRAYESEHGRWIKRDDYDALLAERDAILLQARIWAGEAKTQKATVDEVGKILGGVPDWGPIAAGVEQMKKDAERWRWVRNSCWEVIDLHSRRILVTDDDSHIDAALQGEQP